MGAKKYTHDYVDLESGTERPYCSREQAKFNRLRKLWYKKAKDSGFEDAESYFTGLLNRWSHDLAYSNTILSFTSKQWYYYRASHFLFEYRFTDDTSRLIWQLHSEGESVREIAKTIDQKKLKKSTVQTIVQKLKKIMLKQKETTNEEILEQSELALVIHIAGKLHKRREELLKIKKGKK